MWGDAMGRQQARQRIIQTFMEMVNEMPLESIRIQMLLERAGVSKATFYREFLDKYDLMNSIYKECVDGIVHQKADLKYWNEWTYVAFDYIKEHRTFFKNIISYRGQNSFQEYLMQYYMGNSRRQIRIKSGKEELSQEVLFASEAFSVCGAYYTVKWIQNDFTPDTDTMISLIEQCIPECIRSYYE